MNTIDLCPILRPTHSEFANFYQYMEAIDKQYSKDYGMVKIIPPKSFKARNSDYLRSLDNLVVTGPIEQNVYGKGGHYECLHIQKKSLPLKDYRAKQYEIDKQLNGKSIEDIEKLFWKSLAFSPPLYGADIKVSLMDVEGEWNFNNLYSILSEGLQKKIPGVNEPYIYVGSWKTFFAWHKEDLDLYSTNYLHCGKHKFWYCIREEDGHILEEYAKTVFSEHFSKCTEYLRHKTSIINPYLLKQKFPDLKISKMYQQEGEFMFLFGSAYHSGFNCGFNIAEAVNYATLHWLDLLNKAKSCKCIPDSVKIDVRQLAENLSKGRFKNLPEVKRFIEEADGRKSPKKILRKTIRKIRVDRESDFKISSRIKN